VALRVGRQRIMGLMRKLGLKKPKERTKAVAEDVSAEKWQVGRAYLQVTNLPPRPPLATGTLDAGDKLTLQKDATGSEAVITASAAGVIPPEEKSVFDSANQQSKPKTDIAGHIGALSPEDAGPVAANLAKAKEEIPMSQLPLALQGQENLIHAHEVLKWGGVGIVAVHFLFLLLVMWLFRVSLLGYIWYAACAMPVGLAATWMYYHTKRKRARLHDLMNTTLGREQITALMGDTPDWLTWQQKEKVDWLNVTLLKMWPFYDKAICQAVREALDPILEQYRPHGLIKRIYVHELTFGEAPFRIENVRVDHQSEKEICLEFDFRWAGEAHVGIAVELPFGGNASRMVPKVKNLHMSGTMRILLGPIVPDIYGGCIGAAVISMRKQPRVSFNLSLGKAFGGSFGTKPIMMWLDPFLRETMSSLIVWPNRIIVPLLPESVTGPLDHLMLRNVGILSVLVEEAKDLKKMDLLGKSDPFVELSVLTSHKERTDIKKRTLTPTWNQRIRLLVQEPTTQSLRLQMFDHDVVHINPKEMVTHLNVLKGLKETVDNNTLMGRALIPIEPFAAAPGRRLDKWYDLGKGHFQGDEGCGSGEGEIRLNIAYWPFEMVRDCGNPADAEEGAVLVHLKSASALLAADSGGVSDPYVKLSVGDMKNNMKKSRIKQRTVNPVWDEKYEWTNARISDTLKLEFYDADPYDPDDFLGDLEIDIREEIAQAPGAFALRAWHLSNIPTEKGAQAPASTVTLHVQWIPYNFD
jgi:Ca2+-dependent lipid-binding protein